MQPRENFGENGKLSLALRRLAIFSLVLFPEPVLLFLLFGILKLV